MIRKILLALFFAWLILVAMGQCLGPVSPSRSAANANTQPVPLTQSQPAPKVVLSPPMFDAVLHVTASRLNMRETPNAQAPVLKVLQRGTRVEAGEKQDGWVRVRVERMMGWVSLDYVSASPPVEPAPQRLVQSPAPVRAQAETRSCPARKTCGQIQTCSEARFYLANCSWGYRLDGDNDGVPCESLCR